LTEDSFNPYEAPKSPLAPSGGEGETAPPLWNPGAAANWSLVLSPAFGAFLLAKNWDALGEPKRARSQRIWAWLCVVAILFSIFWPLINSSFSEVGVSVNLWFVAYLLCWYGIAARPQITLVDEMFGKEYRRRGWLVPIFLTLLLLVGVILATVLLAAALAAFGVTTAKQI
jgi:hypothetical protein